MRIVSLLPALSDWVIFLGHEADLVGVSHECDWRTEELHLPRLTRSRIDPSRASAEIHAQVAAAEDALFELDEARLAELKPDLILTQAQCDVCAVNERTVRRVAAGLPGPPRVLSVNPTTLADVFAMAADLSAILGESAESRRLAWRREFQATCEDFRALPAERPRVALLEWLDPPFSSGHWNPELIELAGGREVLGRAGSRSRALGWGEVVAAQPEVVIVAPCGQDLERAEADLAGLADHPDWAKLSQSARRVVAVDGNSYFARPGPRLLESLKIAGAAIFGATRAAEHEGV